MTLPHSTADADSGDDADSADKANAVSDASDPTPDAEPTASAADSEVAQPTNAEYADAVSLPAAGEPPGDGEPDGNPGAESTAEQPEAITAETTSAKPPSKRAKRQSMWKRIGAGRRRRRPIRAKFVLALLVPGLAVVVLATGGVAHFGSQAVMGSHARNMTSVDARAGALVTALQAERASTVTMLAGNLTAEDAGFAARREATDRARSRFADTVTHTDLGGNQRLSSAIDKSVDALKALPAIRTSIENNEVETTEAIQRYTGIIESMLAVPDTAPLGVDSAALAGQLRSAALFAHYCEASASEAHLLYAAIVGGGFDQTTFRRFTDSLRDQTAYLAEFNRTATSRDRQLVQRRLSSSELSRLTDAETTAVRSGTSGNLDLDSDQWRSAAGSKTALMSGIAAKLSDELASDSSAARNRGLLYAGSAGLLGLGLLIISVLVALRIARQITDRLERLRAAALQAAHHSLPEVVEELRDVDAARGSGPKVAKMKAAAAAAMDQQLQQLSTDEIGDVTAALNVMHREAIDIAIRQAQLRLSVAATFVNLARRSQLLVDRLIRLIDKLEHSERDPDRLSELFQLDHLVTRMRRNDENLLVLAGAEGGRRWTRTATLLDVLRAATAEIEQYTRVKIGDVVPVALTAHAVSDVVHLIAELAENATTYSPPHTDVMLQTRISRGAIVIEIHDRGIGIPAEQRNELNERLASPQADNVELSRMMGLYVVARLAARHGITVTLTQVTGQGTVAVVTLPATLLDAASDHAPDSSGDAEAESWGAPQATVPQVQESEITATEPPAPVVSVIPPPRQTTENGAPTDLTSGDDDQSTQIVGADLGETERGHKHWRYGELTERAGIDDVTLAIFESIESEWFTEVPAESTESDPSIGTGEPTEEGGSHDGASASEPNPVEAVSADSTPENKVTTKKPTVGPDNNAGSGKGKKRKGNGRKGSSNQAEPGARTPEKAADSANDLPAAEPAKPVKAKQAKTAGKPQTADVPKLAGDEHPRPATTAPTESAQLTTEPDDSELPYPAAEADKASSEPGPEAAAQSAATASEWAPGAAEASPKPVGGSPPQQSVRASFPMPRSRATADPGSTQQRPEWRSAADMGWQRAQAAAHPRTGGPTPAGLPKRVPMANYVPGGIRNPQQAAVQATPLHRSPEAIGSSLSRYRGGVERGRQAAKTKPAEPTQDDSKGQK